MVVTMLHASSAVGAHVCKPHVTVHANVHAVPCRQNCAKGTLLSGPGM